MPFDSSYEASIRALDNKTQLLIAVLNDIEAIDLRLDSLKKTILSLFTPSSELKSTNLSETHDTGNRPAEERPDDPYYSARFTTPHLDDR